MYSTTSTITKSNNLMYKRTCNDTHYNYFGTILQPGSSLGARIRVRVTLFATQHVQEQT